jgi:hypothetical protein
MAQRLEEGSAFDVDLHDCRTLIGDAPTRGDSRSDSHLM